MNWSRSGTLNAHRLVDPDAGYEVVGKWVERQALSPSFPGANDSEVQHRIQELARTAGVLTPKSHRATDGFQLMSFAEGEGEPRRVLEILHATQGAPCAALVALAQSLAHLHSINPLTVPEDTHKTIERWRDKAEAMILCVDRTYSGDSKARQDAARFKALLPLAETRADDLVLIHNDFRCGNFLVANSKVTALLDYDLSCFGDPWMDVSWFCCPKWRYQKQAFAAGGLGRVERFLDAYQDAGGKPLRRADFAFWNAYSSARLQTLKWVQLSRGCDW